MKKTVRVTLGFVLIVLVAVVGDAWLDRIRWSRLPIEPLSIFGGPACKVVVRETQGEPGNLRHSVPVVSVQWLVDDDGKELQLSLIAPRDRFRVQAPSGGDTLATVKYGTRIVATPRGDELDVRVDELNRALVDLWRSWKRGKQWTRMGSAPDGGTFDPDALRIEATVVRDARRIEVGVFDGPDEDDELLELWFVSR